MKETNHRDQLVLAQTLYGEARGENLLGIIAVAAVVMNRVRDIKRWPDDAASVCLQRYQFSCWLESDPNRATLVRLNETTVKHDSGFRACWCVAEWALRGKAGDPTDGCNHYLNPEGVTEMPPWARGIHPHRIIGRHNFYKL